MSKFAVACDGRVLTAFGVIPRIFTPLLQDEGWKAFDEEISAVAFVQEGDLSLKELNTILDLFRDGAFEDRALIVHVNEPLSVIPRLLLITKNATVIEVGALPDTPRALHVLSPVERNRLMAFGEDSERTMILMMAGMESQTALKRIVEKLPRSEEPVEMSYYELGATHPVHECT